MTSLFKTDLYKLFKTKSFYVIGIIIMAFSALSGFAEAKQINSALDALKKSTQDGTVTSFGISGVNFTDTSIWHGALSSCFSNLFMLTGILVVLFICAEFSHGTIKNVASKGFTKLQMLTSKGLCFILASAIYSILSFLAFFSMNAIFIANDIKQTIKGYFQIPNGFFPVIGILFLLLLAYLAFPYFIAVNIRKTGPSISIFLVTAIILPTIINVVETLLLLKNNNGNFPTEQNFFTVTNFIIPMCANALTANYNPIPSDLMNVIWITIAAHIIVFGGLSFITFKKRDI